MNTAQTREQRLDEEADRLLKLLAQVLYTLAPGKVVLIDPQARIAVRDFDLEVHDQPDGSQTVLLHQRRPWTSYPPAAVPVHVLGSVIRDLPSSHPHYQDLVHFMNQATKEPS